MNELALPPLAALILRYGAAEISERSVPDNLAPVDPDLLEAAANDTSLDDWSADERQRAYAALQRCTDAMQRARSELMFYLRFRSPDDGVPDWVADDLLEMARYHLADENGTAHSDGDKSTIRVRYEDVIRRLAQLAQEDEQRGASESGNSGLMTNGAPRIFSRRTTWRL